MDDDPDVPDAPECPVSALPVPLQATFPDIGRPVRGQVLPTLDPGLYAKSTQHVPENASPPPHHISLQPQDIENPPAGAPVAEAAAQSGAS